jgi:2-dehydropantoate 2-reductase
MLPDRPLIAVVGAGAVGGYYGARLAQHGHDVHFLLRGDYDVVRRNGWNVRSHVGDFALPARSVRAYDDSGKMPKADLVLVTLKTTSNHQLEPLVGPLLRAGTTILTLQNGLGNEDRLAELFGRERVVGGMAFVCINRVGPGVVHHIDHGLVRIGEFGGGPSARVSQIAAMFNASRVPCEVLDDLRRGRWEKLVWNIPFNGLGAVLDLATDRLTGSDEGLALVRALMREVVAAARADGAAVGDGIVERHIANTRTMGAYLSSMQVDRREGRPLEVEAILGEPLRRAAAAGVPTPYLRALYEMARLIAVPDVPAPPKVP